MSNYLRAQILNTMLMINSSIAILNCPLTFIAVVAMAIWLPKLNELMPFYILGGYILALILSRLFALLITSYRTTNYSKVRIVIFRPFSPKNSSKVRNQIVPALCCYGSTLLIADDSFQHSSPYWKDKWFVPLSKGGIEADEFAEMGFLPTPSKNWQDGFGAQIRAADLAVVILDSNGITPAIQWEIAESLTYLGAAKLIAIAIDDEGYQTATTLGLDNENVLRYNHSGKWRRNLIKIVHRKLIKNNN